jgi:hypothetical protein
VLFVVYIIISNSENWRIDIDINVQVRRLPRPPELSKNYHHTYVKFNSSFIDGTFVYRQGSQNVFHMCRSIYPLHFDVRDIRIRIHIIFHENFTQKTRSTDSFYFLKVTSPAAAGIQ